MFKKVLMASAIAVLLASCAAVRTPEPQTLMTAPAPISFDGNVAGQPSDYVLLLVPKANPNSPGLVLLKGDTLRVSLPGEFKRDTTVPINSDSDRNMVLTKGWPQGAVMMDGQYRNSYEPDANTMTVTALRDIRIEGENAPGIKAIHLRGGTFVNPLPGDYPMSVQHVGANGAIRALWRGQFKVLQSAPQARLAPSNFHLRPGANADFQRLGRGQVTPYPLGLLLWGPNGSPLNGVGIAPRDLSRYPRYTGGLLVQDSNQDRRLDPSTDKVVGGIIGAAPTGANGQSAISAPNAAGMPTLSGEALRDAGFPAAGGGGAPNPGLLLIQFTAGDKAGRYQPEVELIGGNSHRFTVSVE